MSIEFKKALDRKRIVSFSQGKKLVKEELEQAQDDLHEASDRLWNEFQIYART